MHTKEGGKIKGVMAETMRREGGMRHERVEKEVEEGDESEEYYGTAERSRSSERREERGDEEGCRDGAKSLKGDLTVSLLGALCVNDRGGRKSEKRKHDERAIKVIELT